ncbi:MAG: NADH-quinone oxidoreductase subunit C [Methanomassiliicoccaceae archaeon]|jgi:NADH-quinone oxidoreductase subunit C|nr:NADH-quinone oxidoreductase subunit C [Methanomassiliicoccaceae archaeon]
MTQDGFIEAPSPEQIAGILEREFSGSVTVKKTAVRRVYMSCDRKAIHALCKYLHDSLNFEQASSVCGVDWVDHMQVVYHLSNYYNGAMVEITVDIPNDDPHVDSVALIWEGADWHERETYELFGIIFDGHPKLERLLTPQNYEFFPFRKSYKLRGQE